MKKMVTASADSEFWNKHSDSYEVGTALEGIIDELGLTDKFFPESGDPTATEEDYRKVLRLYDNTINIIDTFRKKQVSYPERADKLLSSILSDPYTSESDLLEYVVSMLDSKEVCRCLEQYAELYDIDVREV